jgi:NADH:ubiquinone oxidoreductase subunit F (NADH-binding)/NADH:ubiquinone oxidoreductase subunit E/NAD-dependent dihydropyrimidine dehydrogenase PreA subunit
MDNEIIKTVDEIIAEYGSANDAAIPILQAIQGKFNYLPEVALKHLAETTGISPAAIYGISTFYSQFRHQPIGKHLIKVCVGTACHVKGAVQVYDAFKRELKIGESEDTDTDRLFTIEKVACLGCCTIAPVVQIDGVTYGHLTTDKAGETIRDFLLNQDSVPSVNNEFILSDSASQGEIRLGLGSCCVASGSAEVKLALEKSIKKSKINVSVKHVGCVGICNQVPMLEVHKPGESPSFYTKIKAEEVGEVIRKHFQPSNPVYRFRNNLYNFLENYVIDGIPKSLRRYSSEKRDTPVSEFLDGQLNIATEYRGFLKPTDLAEYKNYGGFSALQQCLSGKSQQEIIGQVIQSGLRGRGGAGFPTGIKWQRVKDSVSDEKFVICNGDEGDPGAFMDRMLLESYPFRVIEGLIIAAFAVGATKGIFYIRAEYPLAVKRIREAIKICEDASLLGENILGSDFSFNVRLFEGAGAFVCGEETALIASVEGKRGLPQLRPPYPSEKGLWDKPTLINNTETLATIPWIIRKGGEAFGKIGTDNSKGTKVFALAGKINRGGLIEVPMGITIRKIIEDIGGGIPDGKKFKAVQIGGPSGGCIPALMADTPIDFGSLAEVGAMMGSGGLIVLDETDCMVDIARYFLSFTQDQSCGRCTFCRIGTRRMLDILNKICSGKGKIEDLESLEKLAISVNKGSMCGLGKTAPNPVLSTLKYFRHEYEAHINGHCPTGKCKDLVSYEITNDCIGCTKCAQRCPSGAIALNPYELHVVEMDKCIKCDICRQICPVDAVILGQAKC